MIGYVFVSRGVEFLIDAIQLGLGTQGGLQLHDRLQQRGEQLRLRQEIFDALASDLGADRAGIAKRVGIATSATTTITTDLSASLHAAALTALLTVLLIAGLLILTLATLAALALTTLLTLLALLTLTLLALALLLTGLGELLTLLTRLPLWSIRATLCRCAFLLLLLLQLLRELLGELLRALKLLTHLRDRGVRLVALIQRQCLPLQRLHLLHQLSRIARGLLNRIGAGGCIGVIH